MSAEETQALLAAIVASSDDAIVSKDLNGVVRSWNAAAERIFGYTAAEMVGRSIRVLMPPERANEEDQILERIRRGERVDHFETVRVRKDGRRLDISVTISPVHGPNGQVIGASKIARDVTTLREMVRERERLLASEQLARQQAEQANRVKDEFLATLSHELRTPLNAILGWAQILRTGSMRPEEVKQGLETIERNARAQTRLVEELLDMSRIISGKMRLEVQWVELPKVIEAALESVRPAAEAKGVRLRTTVEGGASLITGDPARLQQVVWNLLNNAIRHTPRGGSVEVSLRRTGADVELTVKDTGQGIRPEFLPHLFTRFMQADSSTTRQYGGLGLGLAIVRSLVEMHGGSVRASSAGEGKGATFVVTLPLNIGLEDERGERSARTAPEGSGERVMNLAGVKALVVDDEPDACFLVKRVLESHGARVWTASSAQEGFEALRREQPDVLVSDIGMPGEDGYSLLARVRELKAAEGGTVPAVALTAFARSEDRRRALMAGFQIHVAKPVEPAELITVVASLTTLSRGGR